MGTYGSVTRLLRKFLELQNVKSEMPPLKVPPGASAPSLAPRPAANDSASAVSERSIVTQATQRSMRRRLVGMSFDAVVEAVSLLVEGIASSAAGSCDELSVAVALVVTGREAGTVVVVARPA